MAIKKSNYWFIDDDFFKLDTINQLQQFQTITNERETALIRFEIFKLNVEIAQARLDAGLPALWDRETLDLMKIELRKLTSQVMGKV